jgi:phosphoribosylaminoimidazole-succinocarboxamide synthase
MQAVQETNLGGMTLRNRGKVRDIYDLGEALIIVASDRISAFDVIMPNGVPEKGKILTALSVFWFDLLKDLVPNHLISTEVDDYPPEAQAHREVLEGRSMLVKKARVFPIECVVRGYLAGSGWKEYQESGKVCGVALPSGLRQSDRLPEPIFTPASKAESGHDENISFEKSAEIIGAEAASRLKELSLAIYRRASDHALSRGVILADTKFEFGLIDGDITLVDEVLTPDSSRFWLVSEYQPGRSQNAFDKQYLRDYLETLDWDKTPPGPHLPDRVVEGTRGKYMEAYRLITGEVWPGA